MYLVENTNKMLKIWDLVKQKVVHTFERSYYIDNTKQLEDSNLILAKYTKHEETHLLNIFFPLPLIVVSESLCIDLIGITNGVEVSLRSVMTSFTGIEELLNFNDEKIVETEIYGSNQTILVDFITKKEGDIVIFCWENSDMTRII